MTWNKDEAAGKLRNLKGRIKEGAGAISGDRDLENRGAAERVGGAAQQGVGRAKRRVGEAIKKVGRKIAR